MIEGGRSLLDESRLKKLIATCRVMRRLLPRVRKLNCLLVDTPIHGNLGDQAIVLAEQQMLTELHLRHFELRAPECGKQAFVYARLIPKRCTVLIHGGGFMGSIWPREEYRLRRLLKAYAHRRVIMMPQTVTFDLQTEEGRQFFEESRRCYMAHPDLTVFVREEKSAAFMRTNMPEVRTVLVPDIVTSLVRPMPETDRSGVLFCMRSDAEKHVTDKTVQEIEDIVRQAVPDEQIRYSDTLIPELVPVPMRERTVDQKLHEFAAARLIVTDRLHGMVFAAITGTPCIALSNSNGKVKGVYEWLRHCSYVRYADTAAEVGTALETLDLTKRYHYETAPLTKAFAPLTEALKRAGDRT